MENIVEFKNVIVEYQMKKYNLRAVNDFSLKIKKGKITALVGESGSGKTTIANTLLKNVSEPGRVISGNVLYYHDNEVIDITKLEGESLNSFRWSKISMVFQGAQNALNPIMTIYDQFYETLKVHRKNVTEVDVIEISKRYLELVNLDTEKVFKAYPHELSGGMKQRVMIAFSLLLEPSLIILDEPTTALDVIVQDYIFKLLKKINLELKISMLLLTHDISVVSKYADYVAVMYGGKLMEYGTVKTVFGDKSHPYTEGLINSTPSLDKDIELIKTIPGNPPDLTDMPTGCIFHPRCAKAFDQCHLVEPKNTALSADHIVKCLLYEAGDDK